MWRCKSILFSHALQSPLSCLYRSLRIRVGVSSVRRPRALFISASRTSVQVNPCPQMASENSESSIGSENLPPLTIRGSKSSFQFEINYPKTKNLPIGEVISSPTFTACGHDWLLEYCVQEFRPEDKGTHLSLFLAQLSDFRDINVEFSFELLGKFGKFVTIYTGRVENSEGSGHCWGSETCISRDKIDDFYCMNDILVISCNISILAEPIDKNYPGGLCEHMEKFWEKGERFDVTFEVEGESISAHRFILSARSPVFEAKLCGSMVVAKMEHIKINEMKAKVFKALLDFIYTDQLPIDKSSDVDETLSVELLQDLFVAADRYALDKLTLLCEEQLKRNLSVDMVAATLALADRHSCISLKEKCLEFASARENFSGVALTEGYLQIMQGFPALFAEFSEKVKSAAPFTYNFAKKQRTF